MKTLLNIRADKEVKEKAQRIAEELGLPLSTIINAYLKQFIREEEIYFSAAPKMTPWLEMLIEQAREDLAKGKNVSPLFSSAHAMDEYLNSL